MSNPLILLMLVAITTADPSEKRAEFQFETKGSNSVIAQAEQDRTVFVITSERGRGWAHISLAEGTWPERITLRFRLAEGKGFTALEGFQLSTDRIAATGAAKVTDFEQNTARMSMRFAFLGPDGKPDQTDITQDIAAGTLELQVQRQQGWMEVTLPARMLQGASKLNLGWTDWYRR